MLTNYDFIPLTRLTESLAGILMSEDITIPTSPQAYPLEESIYAHYMGTYEGFGCKAIVDRKGDQLFFVWNDTTIIPFYPISETKFHHTWHDWECNFVTGTNNEVSFLGMKKIT